MLTVRVRAIVLFALMCSFALAASAFLVLLGADALEERSAVQFFADSNTYLRIFRGTQALANDSLLGVANNYLGPLLLLRVFGDNVHVIMVVNVAVFLVSLLSITRRLGVDPLLAGGVLLVSPLTVSTLLSVNKEIFVFPFIALAVAGFQRRSAFLVLAALATSMLVRWQLAVFFLMLLLLLPFGRAPRRRVAGVLLLLGCLSIAYLISADALEPVLAVVELSNLNDPNPGRGSYVRLLELQDSGLYVLIFPLKAAHLLFSMGLRVSRVIAPANVYNDVFVTLHSTVTIAMFLALLRSRRFRLSSDLVFASVVFLAVFALTPIYAPRYLYPVYVAWALVLAGAPDAVVTAPAMARAAAQGPILSPKGFAR